MLREEMHQGCAAETSGDKPAIKYIDKIVRVVVLCAAQHHCREDVPPWLKEAGQSRGRPCQMSGMKDLQRLVYTQRRVNCLAQVCDTQYIS